MVQSGDEELHWQLIDTRFCKVASLPDLGEVVLNGIHGDSGVFEETVQVTR